MFSGSRITSFYSDRTHIRRQRQTIVGEPLRIAMSRTSANYLMAPEINLERVKSTESDVARAPINGHFELIAEHPFDSTIKRMSTVWQFIPDEGQEGPEDYDLLLCTPSSRSVLGRPTNVRPDMKGAVERVLDRCSYIGIGESRRPITQKDKDHIVRHVNAFADEGLRVLCLAGTQLPHSEKHFIITAPRADLEKDCGVLGLVGI
jgi:Na+-exporting ATPase